MVGNFSLILSLSHIFPGTIFLSYNDIYCSSPVCSKLILSEMQAGISKNVYKTRSICLQLLPGSTKPTIVSCLVVRAGKVLKGPNKIWKPDPSKRKPQVSKSGKTAAKADERKQLRNPVHPREECAHPLPSTLPTLAANRPNPNLTPNAI